jgi:hypothetical protein
MTIFLHPVRINRNFGLARLYCTYIDQYSIIYAYHSNNGSDRFMH